jgi:hypothetical protein
MVSDETVGVSGAEIVKMLEHILGERNALRAKNALLTSAHSELATKSIHDDKHIIGLRMEIGMLKSDNERMRAALEKLAKYGNYGVSDEDGREYFTEDKKWYYHPAIIARAALEPTP